MVLQIGAAQAGVDALNFLIYQPDTELSNVQALETGAGLLDFCGRLFGFANWWRNTIVRGTPNDGVVPTANQHFTSSNLPGLPFTSVHTSETVDGVASIRAALNQFTGHIDP